MKNELPKTMKAVVAYGPENYQLIDKETPTAGLEELIIRVKACGICGSDVHAYHGAPSYWGNEKMKAWMIAPVTPGHEFYGEVVQLGEGAKEKFNVEIGDTVIAEQIIPCRKCKYCIEGDYHLCDVHNMYGFQSKIAEGAMAEYMKIYSSSIVHKIPKNVTLKESASIEPLSCAIHAVERADIQLGDVVMIAGAGPIGLFIAQVALLKNPKTVIVVDINEKRLETAKKLGATYVINPKKQDPIEFAKSLTNGYGCDRFIEVTGNPIGVEMGLNSLKKKGTFLEFSVFSKETSVDWSIIGEKKELNVLGAHISPNTYPIAIDLFDKKKVSVDGIVTQEFLLSDFEKAFKVAQNADESVKVLLVNK